MVSPVPQKSIANSQTDASSLLWDTYIRHPHPMGRSPQLGHGLLASELQKWLAGVRTLPSLALVPVALFAHVRGRKRGR